MKKKISLLALITIILFTACNNSKTVTNNDNSTSKNMKANLIDGTWELNYIMNLSKSFDEMYPETKPTITFNSNENTTNGSTGCNNFTSSFSIDGNKLTIDEKMAITRKMCPNLEAEQIFLETLQKVTNYSVTEQGKTLNLMMGDIGVMRFTRK